MSEVFADAELNERVVRRLDHLRELAIGRSPSRSSREPIIFTKYLALLVVLGFGFLVGQQVRDDFATTDSPPVEIAGLSFRLPTVGWDEFPFSGMAANVDEVSVRRDLVNARRRLRLEPVAISTSCQSALDARLLLGDHCVRQADWNGALKHYQEAQQLDSDNLEARISVAQCQTYLGHLELALQAWEEIERDASELLAWRTEAWRNIAGIKRRLNHEDAELASQISIRHHRQSLQDSELPVSERLRLAVGLSQALKQTKTVNGLRDAEQVLGNAIALNETTVADAKVHTSPQGQTALLQSAFLLAERARLRCRLSEMVEANHVDLLRQAESDVRAALQLCEATSEPRTGADRAKGERLLMRILIAQERYREALQVSRTAVASFDRLMAAGSPELAADLAGTWLQTARVLTTIGDKAKSLKAYQQARYYYDEALKLSPRPDLASMIAEVDDALNGETATNVRNKINSPGPGKSGGGRHDAVGQGLGIGGY